MLHAEKLSNLNAAQWSCGLFTLCAVIPFGLVQRARQIFLQQFHCFILVCIEALAHCRNFSCAQSVFGVHLVDGSTFNTSGCLEEAKAELHRALFALEINFTVIVIVERRGMISFTQTHPVNCEASDLPFSRLKHLHSQRMQQF